jgi:hypothetical protein
VVRTVDTFCDDALDIEFGACVEEIAWGTVERADGAKARADKVERFECAPAVAVRLGACVAFAR